MSDTSSNGSRNRSPATTPTTPTPKRQPKAPKKRASRATKTDANKDRDKSKKQAATQLNKDQKARDNAEAFRQKYITNAINNNLPGVYVISTGSFYDSPNTLAAYLGFSDAEKFRQWVSGLAGTPQSTDVHEQLELYHDQRRNNYGVPLKSVGAGSNKTSGGINVSDKSVFQMLAAPEAKPLLDPAVGTLTKAGLHDQIAATFDRDTNVQRYAIAIHIAGIVHLIHYHRAQFPDSHKPSAERHNVIGESGLVAEDVNRAVNLLRFYYRQCVKPKAERHWFETAVQRSSVVPTQYFNDSDRTIHKSKGAEFMDGEDTGLAPGVAANQRYYRLKAQEVGLDQDFEDDPYPADSATQVEWENNWSTKFEQAVEKTATKQVLTAKRELKYKRNPLTTEQLSQACYLISSQANVLHDNPALQGVDKAKESDTVTDALHKASGGSSSIQVRLQTLV